MWGAPGHKKTLCLTFFQISAIVDGDIDLYLLFDDINVLMSFVQPEAFGFVNRYDFFLI